MLTGGVKEKKQKTIYVCQECGVTSGQWQGKCFECNGWNTLVEQKVDKKSAGMAATSAGPTAKKSSGELKKLTEFQSENSKLGRYDSGSVELNRVLGGGFVSGSILLFGGNPGIGKSTLLLQTLDSLAKNLKALYISGEESGRQVAERAERLGLKNAAKIDFLSTHNLEEAIETLKKLNAEVVVVDSVQTLSSPDFDSVAGTVSQIRAVTHEFMEHAKSTGCVVILVGHVTKEGVVAGPRLLEHMVDGVFYFELSNDGNFRLLRGQKNRFGPTHELAVFEMVNTGLQEVNNPSARFLAERPNQMAGSAVVAQLEGTRPLLFEVQSLVQRCYQGFPRRTTQGVDQNRIAVLLAVMEKTLSLNFSEQDVYCKVSSGGKIYDAAADLAICASLYSALLNEPLARDEIYLGEVGLGGELRSCPMMLLRLNEAKTVGMKKAYIPKHSLKEAKAVEGIELIPISNIKELREKVDF